MHKLASACIATANIHVHCTTANNMYIMQLPVKECKCVTVPHMATVGSSDSDGASLLVTSASASTIVLVVLVMSARRLLPHPPPPSPAFYCIVFSVLLLAGELAGQRRGTR